MYTIAFEFSPQLIKSVHGLTNQLIYITSFTSSSLQIDWNSMVRVSFLWCIFVKLSFFYCLCDYDLKIITINIWKSSNEAGFALPSALSTLIILNDTILQTLKGCIFFLIVLYCLQCIHVPKSYNSVKDLFFWP